MSYARWSEGDLYIYWSARDNSPICMECLLMPTFEYEFNSRLFPELRGEKAVGHEDFTCSTLEEMRDHVLQHIEAGHNVAPGCLPQIDRDIERKETDGL